MSKTIRKREDDDEYDGQEEVRRKEQYQFRRTMKKQKFDKLKNLDKPETEEMTEK